MPAKKPASKDKEDLKDNLLYVCPYCERGFKSKSALNGHLGVCKAKPDDEDEEDSRDEDPGIKLFDDEEEEEDAQPIRRRHRNDEDDEDDDGYQCGKCGYVARREFRFCPKCGTENEF